MKNFKKAHLKIKRQDAPGKNSFWEEFSVPFRENMNVIDLLMEIQKEPVTKDGGSTSPVVWDCGCREELCGACTMIINGKVMQACSALVKKLKQPVILEPMSKFPVIRDLWVDRTKMFDALKKTHAWNDIDGYFDFGPGPRVSEKEQVKAYLYSSCIVCGSCLEACPQYNERSPFMGVHAMGQVLFFNRNFVGNFNKDERLDLIMQMGGISECGKSGNCAEVCPKEIPLSDAIARLGWDTTLRAIRRFFSE